MKDSSWIELNQSALRKNIRYIKKRLGSGVRFASVIKGNAYGHGIEKFVPLAEKSGLNYFAVFDASEAERALQVKRSETEIMIMGMIDNAELEWAIEQGISFYVFELDRLQAAISAARKLKKKARLHVELETGMNRTGFEVSEMELVIALLRENQEFLELAGLCSHLAGAESIANYMRIHDQLENYNHLRTMLNSRNFKFNNHHIASSAAALIYPETIMDMARIGIAQYGYWPSMETKMNNLLSDANKFTRDPLQRVLSWKSRIMSVKKVMPGKFVSYGNAYLTTKPMTVATVPIGYFHGYRRSLSNSGHVLVRGSKANVIGMVNMNVFQVNVSQIPNVQKGDEVVIIGTQGKNRISVASFAELSNQINYEFLTRLPVSIPRQICENGH
jgi:alanine racemase